MTRRYRYPLRASAVACAQGGAGLLLTAGPIMIVQPAGPVAWAMASAAALFSVYFGRAVVRYLTRIELSERGIRAVGPLGATIPWDGLCSVRLNYYTTRSDRSGGWMQLDVRGAGRAIRVDSSLTGFAGVAEAAGREALRRRKQLDERTLANLGALGISIDG